MRTIDQCAELFKQQDPDTKVNKTFIRTMVLENKIPHVMCGNKYLINLDKLIEYFSGVEEKSEPKPESKQEKRVKIRRMIV
ncbi:DNA-binding protein [Clostridium sp. AF32-12BH]|nr:DNA-binding protein [Clostridium sp. AF32-12BH]